MKKLIIILFPIFVFTLFSSNGNKEQNHSQTNFGEAVFYEIFPSLLDSIHTNRRLIPPPPPPEYFKYMDSAVTLEEGFEEWKKSAHYKKWLNNWETKKDSIKRDTTSIYLVVQDSISRTYEDDSKELIKHFNHRKILPDSLIISDSFKLDLTKLESNQKKLKFLFRSDFPEGREFWRTDYEINIAASIGFSNIIFDKSRNYGVLNAGYTMAPLNGYGVRVFIRKDENGMWIIDKVEGTWIS